MSKHPRKSEIAPFAAAHKVRIVGGFWKRTPISVVSAPGLRPTPDRVRETLFNWLANYVNGARCLDLFAGSGALGLEALSRGAADVLFNEPFAQAREAIKTRLKDLHLPPGATWQAQGQDALSCIQAVSDASLDIVFLDPPFHQGWISKVLPLVTQKLRHGGHVYIESEQNWAAPASEESISPQTLGLNLLKASKAGVVHYHLFQRAAPSTI